MDVLEILGLKASASIGVHDWEQRIKQPLVIDLRLTGDFTACDDDLTKTMDYDVLCQQVTELVENNHFRLIETVAQNIANLLQNGFKPQQLQVRVCKPTAIKNAANVCITISR